MDKWEAIARNSSEDALVQILGGNFSQELVYAAHTELTRREEVRLAPETNLTKWRKELAEGKRTTHTFDDLWRKACDEMTEAEFLRDTAPRVSTSLDDQKYWDNITWDDVRE